MSSLSDTSFQEIGEPLAVGLVSTEGEKLLNALRKIQTKLSDGRDRHSRDRPPKKTLPSTADTNGHHMCCAHASGDHHSRHHKPYTEKVTEDANNRLIETRLKLIETQLKNISMQLSANSCANHQTDDPKTELRAGHKSQRRASPPKARSVASDTEDNKKFNDKYELSIDAIRRRIRSDGEPKVPKSMSLDRIDNRCDARKHFRLHYNDIPFILGTNTSKSHSVIVNRQIELSRLKQHNRLCEQTSGQTSARQMFDQSVKNKLLDNEIKDLLYDLQEEHNYICEEIQYLSKQLDSITDPQRKSDFNRELYFLSRRILAKKRQINELKELHQIVRQSGGKRVDKSADTKTRSETRNIYALKK